MEAWCHGLSQPSHSSVETLNWTQDQRNKTLHSSTFLIISSFHTTLIISITSVTNKKSVLFFLLACTCFIFGIPVMLYSLFNNINVLHVYLLSYPHAITIILILILQTTLLCTALNKLLLRSGWNQDGSLNGQKRNVSIFFYSLSRESKCRTVTQELAPVKNLAI